MYKSQLSIIGTRFLKCHSRFSYLALFSFHPPLLNPSFPICNVYSLRMRNNSNDVQYSGTECFLGTGDIPADDTVNHTFFCSARYILFWVCQEQRKAKRHMRSFLCGVLFVTKKTNKKKKHTFCIAKELV